MAVSVDTVYQRVLALANKEQRGYITPQEFNLFADQAQLEIFEQYFYDLNQFGRVPGNHTIYSDMVDTLEEKISIFKVGPQNRNNGQPIPANWYKLTDLNFNGKIVTEVRFEDYQKTQTLLLKPNANRPVYWIRGGRIFFDGVLPGQNVSCNYIRRPEPPNWSYIVSANSNTALFNSGPSRDFEIHASDESELVYKILKLAGVSMVREDIARAAQGMEMSQIQQEKQ